MMRNKTFNGVFFMLCILINASISAQNYTWQANIEPLEGSGWHKIILSSTVVCNANRDLGDIRLFDTKNREIPFDIMLQSMNNDTKDSVIYTKVNKENYELNSDSKRKITILKFNFEKEQRIDKIVFNISEPEYYFREAKVYTNRISNIKREERIIKEHVTTFILNSKGKSSFDLNGLFTHSFFIEIENNDNVPLIIKDVQLKQLAVFLVADLKNTERYALRYGDPKLKSPKYDITHFIDKNKPMSFLSINEIIPLRILPLVEEPSKKYYFWQNKWFLWTCIVAGVFIIFIFSRKLVMDMRRK